MNISIIISGVPRGFEKHLWPFLQKLPFYYHFYISFAKTNDRFFNDSVSLDSITSHPSVKYFSISEDEDEYKCSTQREKNTILQWKRMYNLFTQLPKTKGPVVRCRPDIQFLCSIEEFVSFVETPLESNQIRVPLGFDIFDTQFIKPTETIESYLNDQFAVGYFESMLTYSLLYKSPLLTEITPIISERSLCAHLKENGIKVVREPLSYKLVLSNCFTIAICGDSGSGKSTLSRLIQSILPFDQSLLLETDRYHKWERGHQNYKHLTHLNPEANNLEKMSEDVYRLHLGEDIYAVDYDHSTGKFTEPQHLPSNSFVLFCGLHTLYKQSLREITHLKVFLDTDPELAKKWKVQRDIHERGAKEEDVLKAIESRETDFQTFIAPQKKYANILIHYFEDNSNQLCLQIKVKEKELFPILLQYFLLVVQSFTQSQEELLFLCKKGVSSSVIAQLAEKIGFPVGEDGLRPSYDGILQYFFILLTWKI